MTTLTNNPWWAKDNGTDPHVRLIPLIRSIESAQKQRYVNMRKMIAVYEYGFGASATTTNDTNVIDDSKLHFNVAKNAMDTMHAQVCTPKIAPMLLTEGGDWGQRNRAKMATKAIEGVFAENDVEELKEDVVLDAQLAYCGFAVVSHRMTGEDTADLTIEHVPPNDILVDNVEGRYRKPRCIYRRLPQDRYVALAEYGKPDADLYGSAKARKAAILKALTRDPDGETRTAPSDEIELWEAWHLPSGSCDEGENHDGLHVIAIEGCTLFVEPWDRHRFPIAIHRPEKARAGFWGLAAMRPAMSGQREYEKVTEKLQRAHAKMGSSSLVVYGNQELNSRLLANGQGQVIVAPGPPGSIQELTPSPANAQTYQYRESIATDILRYLGLSDFSAQSEVPAGMSNASGKALEAFEGSESKRGIIRHRSIERFIVDLSDLVIDEARALVKAGISISTRYRSKGSFERIDWKDIVDVLEDRKNYVTTTFPIGMLAQTPAAKFAQLDSLLERQVITIEQFKRLFEMPDLEAENGVDMADTEIIDKNLDYMVATGRYLSPQSFDNLKLIIERGGKVLNSYRVRGVPEARLELVHRYILDAKAIIDDAQSRAAAMQSGPPGMPMTAANAPPLPPPPMPMAS